MNRTQRYAEQVLYSPPQEVNPSSSSFFYGRSDYSEPLVLNTSPKDARDGIKFFIPPKKCHTSATINFWVETEYQAGTRFECRVRSYPNNEDLATKTFATTETGLHNHRLRFRSAINEPMEITIAGPGELNWMEIV